MEVITRTKAENTRLWRAKHRQEGLCVFCSNKAVLGKTRCVSCASREAYWRRQDRKNNGDEVREKAHQYRVNHIEHLRDLNNKWLARLRAKRKGNGLCPSCGQEPIIGLLYCSSCLYKSSVKKKKYRQTHFAFLREKALIWRKQYLETNRCYRCGAPLMEDESKYCFACMAGRTIPIIKGVLKKGVYSEITH